MPHDVFISYSHRDNISAREDDGWVDNFHKALYRYLSGFLGRDAVIWRDQTKMKANYLLSQAVFDNLDDSLVLIPILSGNFLNSRWCPQELARFCARNDGAANITTSVFPVVKTPISTIPPQLTASFFKYDFEMQDGAGNYLRPLDPSYGDEYRTKFNLKVSDLAREIADYLITISSPEPLPEVEDQLEQQIKIEEGNSEEPAQKAAHPIIYLAEPSPDLWDKYEEIKRDLQQRSDKEEIKFEILPHDLTPLTPKPPQAETYKKQIRTDVEKSVISVHLIGKNNNPFPARSDLSYLHLQTAVAAEQHADPNFKRLIWIPRDAHNDQDADHQNLLDTFRQAPPAGFELFQDSLEIFKTGILDALKPKPEEPEIPPDPEIFTLENPPWIYVLYNKSDLTAGKDLENKLRKHKCGVFPASAYLNGSEEEKKNAESIHKDWLIKCHAVLIYWHQAPLTWLINSTFDLQSIKAERKGRRFRAQALFYDGDSHAQEKADLLPSIPNLKKFKGVSNLPHFFSQLNFKTEVQRAQ